MKISGVGLKTVLQIVERIINKDPSRFYALLLFIALMFMIFVFWKLVEEQHIAEIQKTSQISR
jgi:hypothetical protein